LLVFVAEIYEMITDNIYEMINDNTTFGMAAALPTREMNTGTLDYPEQFKPFGHS
jgi:hypothetical protein